MAIAINIPPKKCLGKNAFSCQSVSMTFEYIEFLIDAIASIKEKSNCRQIKIIERIRERIMKVVCKESVQTIVLTPPLKV